MPVPCPAHPCLSIVVSCVPPLLHFACHSLGRHLSPLFSHRHHHLLFSDTLSPHPPLPSLYSAVTLVRCRHCCLPPSSLPQPRLGCHHLLSVVASHQPQPSLVSSSLRLRLSAAISYHLTMPSAMSSSSPTFHHHISKGRVILLSWDNHPTDKWVCPSAPPQSLQSWSLLMWYHLTHHHICPNLPCTWLFNCHWCHCRCCYPSLLFYCTSSTRALPAFAGWLMHSIYCWPLLVVTVALTIVSHQIGGNGSIAVIVVIVTVPLYSLRHHFNHIQMCSCLLWHVAQLFYIVLHQNTSLIAKIKLRVTLCIKVGGE